MIRILFCADTHLGFDHPGRTRIAGRHRGPDFFANYRRAQCPSIHPRRNFRLLGRLRGPRPRRFRPPTLGYDAQMNHIITPLNLLVLAVASWINRRQAVQIEFLCKQRP